MTICLLSNTRAMLGELEHHQIVLQTMQAGSAAGSFQDEITKWQRKLQLIETVVKAWLTVQDLWVELEEVGLSLSTTPVLMLLVAL